MKALIGFSELVKLIDKWTTTDTIGMAGNFYVIQPTRLKDEIAKKFFTGNKDGNCKYECYKKKDRGWVYNKKLDEGLFVIRECPTHGESND